MEATPEWRASLSFGSWVDAVKIDPIDRSRCWMHALIEEETDTQFKLEFEQLSDYYSRWVPKDSVELAPMDSKKKTEAVDDDWFMSLKPGDRLDCMDPFDKWYACARFLVPHFMLLRSLTQAPRAHRAVSMAGTTPPCARSVRRTLGVR